MLNGWGREYGGDEDSNHIRSGFTSRPPGTDSLEPDQFRFTYHSFPIHAVNSVGMRTRIIVRSSRLSSPLPNVPSLPEIAFS